MMLTALMTLFVQKVVMIVMSETGEILNIPLGMLSSCFGGAGVIARRRESCLAQDCWAPDCLAHHQGPHFRLAAVALWRSA